MRSMCALLVAPVVSAGVFVVGAGAAFAAPVGFTAQVFQFDPSTGDPNTPRFTSGSALNNAGQFVGSFGLSTETTFLYSPVTGIELLDAKFGVAGVRPAEIFDSGVIVGTIAPNFESARAFVGQVDGTVHYLPTLGNDPTLQTIATAGREPGGVILGSSTTSQQGQFGPVSVAVAWVGGEIMNLGNLGGEFGVATAANGAGVIVGDSSREVFGPTRAFRWTSTGGMVELATPDEYTVSTARGITEDGFIVGEVGNGSTLAAAIWSPDGELTVIPSVFGEAEFRNAEVFDMNEFGDFVGHELDFANDSIAAVLWQDGVGYRLADYTSGLPEGVRLDRAVAINELGQILVNGFDTENFQFVTVLLTPVPTPSSGALLALGAFVASRRRR